MNIVDELALTCVAATEKRSMWPFAPSEESKANAFADLINKPENIAALNKLIERRARTKWKQPLNRLTPDEFDESHAYAMANPHFSALRKSIYGDETVKAADLTGMRDEFENSALKEKALRQHAQRLEDLAARRAANEDTSASGYANTLAARLAPVPHTMGEAAVRVPGMIAGGVLGHEFGKSFEPLEAEGLERVFSPLGGKGQENIGKAVEARMAGMGGDPIKIKELMDKLLTTPGEEISGALRRPVPMITPRGGSQALRQEFAGALRGEGKINNFQKIIGNLVRQTGSKDKAKAVLPALSKYRLGGAAGGALLGGAALGLPFAIRALFQKRHGGEAAVRARGQASRAIGSAEGESKHREDLLNKLPASKQANLGFKGMNRHLGMLQRMSRRGSVHPENVSKFKDILTRLSRASLQQNVRTMLEQDPERKLLQLKNMTGFSHAVNPQFATASLPAQAKEYSRLGDYIRAGGRNPASELLGGGAKTAADVSPLIRSSLLKSMLSGAAVGASSGAVRGGFLLGHHGEEHDARTRLKEALRQMGIGTLAGATGGALGHAITGL